MIEIFLELDEDDYKLRDGWCITCKYNLGPCLPGGTLNQGLGCLCSHIEHTREYWEEWEDIEPETGIPLYRWEVVDDSDIPCPDWEKGEETPKLYGIKI